jgi:hypothetical protein
MAGASWPRTEIFFWRIGKSLAKQLISPPFIKYCQHSLENMPERIEHTPYVLPEGLGSLLKRLKEVAMWICTLTNDLHYMLKNNFKNKLKVQDAADSLNL